jgi:hypothetical protein
LQALTALGFYSALLQLMCLISLYTAGPSNLISPNITNLPGLSLS